LLLPTDRSDQAAGNRRHQASRQPLPSHRN
jgi:hypothetical protein